MKLLIVDRDGQEHIRHCWDAAINENWLQLYRKVKVVDSEVVADELTTNKMFEAFWGITRFEILEYDE